MRTAVLALGAMTMDESVAQSNCRAAFPDCARVILDDAVAVEVILAVVLSDAVIVAVDDQEAAGVPDRGVHGQGFHVRGSRTRSSPHAYGVIPPARLPPVTAGRVGRVVGGEHRPVGLLCLHRVSGLEVGRRKVTATAATVDQRYGVVGESQQP